jgi:hypothetical protein
MENVSSRVATEVARRASERAFGRGSPPVAVQ